MTTEILHDEEIIPFIEDAEKTFGEASITRADRGPSIQTSVAIESASGKPLARMNLYGPWVLLSKPLTTRTSMRSYALGTDLLFGAYDESFDKLEYSLPSWVKEFVYVAEVNVLEPMDRQKGIGKSLLSASLGSYTEKSRHLKQLKAIGITNNPAMIGLALSLGGVVSEEYTVIGVKPDITIPNTRNGITSDLIIVDVGITDEDDIFSLGFSVLYDSWDIYGGIVAIVIPERRISQYENESIDENALIGQTLVLLNPELDRDQLKLYERDLFMIVSRHKWANIIQAGNNQLRAYSGVYLKEKDGMSVFEINVT